MNISILNPVEYPGWDDLILTSGQTSFFHTAGWARVLNETYGYEPQYFTITANDGRLVGTDHLGRSRAASALMSDLSGSPSGSSSTILQRRVKSPQHRG